MNKDIVSKIDELIDGCDTNLINDAIKLINIKSVREESLPGAPFGKGPRAVLDEVLEMGRANGFFTRDYGVGVVSLSFEDRQPELGIWLHGDVVAEGDGWNFEPYNATVYKNRIIGRGATDNKGQLSAIFNLFRIFKELEIKLNYNPALYVGSCEESGMYDMKGIPGNPDAKGFINVCTPPKLSLVPDGEFPVGYGAKGLTNFFLKSKKKLNFTLTAGKSDSPGVATAVFKTQKIPPVLPDCTVDVGAQTIVSAFSPPRHSAHPSKDGTAITKLCGALATCESICANDKKILKLFKDISLDINGHMFGIDVKGENVTPAVVFIQSIDCQDGFPILHLKIRYPIELDRGEMLKGIQAFCDKEGFEVEESSSHLPYVNPSDTEVVKALTRVANEVTGRDNKPYINGATYAHYLPDAYIFGMEGCLPPEDFEKGRGEAHGVDECVSVERLKRAMKIYARALLALDEVKW